MANLTPEPEENKKLEHDDQRKKNLQVSSWGLLYLP